MNEYDLQQELRTKGFVFVPDLLEAEEVDCYRQELAVLAGIPRDQSASGYQQRPLHNRGLKPAWHLPYGVVPTRPFWPLVTHESLLTVVSALLGNDIFSLLPSGVHVGFATRTWHRDGINGNVARGSDWHEGQDLLRVNIYFQSYRESRFELGLIPGSHRPLRNSFRRQLYEVALRGLGAFSHRFPFFQRWPANAEWLATEPGDTIIFDPRILRAGSPALAPIYSIFLTYGNGRLFASRRHREGLGLVPLVA